MLPRLLIAAIVAGLAVALLASFWDKRTKRKQINQQFDRRVRAKKTVLNEKEYELYKSLQSAFPHHLILCQVALSQLIDVKPNAPRGLANKFYRLVADFVICTTSTQPLAVIELDGRAHQTAVQAERDRRKDAVINASGLKIIRIRANSMPSARELKRLVWLE